MQTWVFSHRTMRASCRTRNIFKKTLRFSRNRHFYLVWGGFVWGLNGGGLTGKCQSFARDPSFWPACHTPRHFSRKMQGTDHLLCAFWTAGFTARPPDIGSVRCTIIFQVSNRTIRCILKRSARLYGDCMWSQIIWQNIAYRCAPIWLKISYKKTNFLCINPCRSKVLRVFLDASRHSAFTHVVFSQKSKYWRN